MFRFTNNDNYGHGGHEDDDVKCDNITCAFHHYWPTASGRCQDCERLNYLALTTHPSTAAEVHALRRQDENRDFNERREFVEDMSHREFGRLDRLNAQNDRAAFARSRVPRDRFNPTLHSDEHPPAPGSAQVTRQPHQFSIMQQGWNHAAAGPSTEHAHAGPVRTSAPNTAGPVREHLSASTSTGSSYPGSDRMRQLSSDNSTPAPPRTEMVRQRIQPPAPAIDPPTRAAAGADYLEQTRNNFQMQNPGHFANTVTPPGSGPITRPRAIQQRNQSRISQVPRAPVLRPRRGRSNLAGDFAHGGTASQQAPAQQMTPANNLSTSGPLDANMPRLPPVAHLPDNTRGHRYEDQIPHEVLPPPQSSFNITPPQDPSIPQILSSASSSSNTSGDRLSQQILALVLPPAATSFELTRHQDPNTPRISAPSHFPDTGPATPAQHSSRARDLPARPDYAIPAVQVTPPSPSSSSVPQPETAQETNSSTIITSTSDESAVVIHYQEEEKEEAFVPYP